MAHTLALFPLNTVLFPGMTLPLHIFEARYRRMITTCLAMRAPFGVVLIRSGVEVGGRAVPYAVGTQARIKHHRRLADGGFQLEAVGVERFRIVTLREAEAGYLTGVVEPFALTGAGEPGAQQAATCLAPRLSRYLKLLGQSTATHLTRTPLPADPAELAYLAAVVAQVPMREKQGLLATATAEDLLHRECWLYRREVSLLQAMLGGPPEGDLPNFSPN